MGWKCSAFVSSSAPAGGGRRCGGDNDGGGELARSVSIRARRKRVSSCDLLDAFLLPPSFGLPAPAA